MNLLFVLVIDTIVLLVSNYYFIKKVIDSKVDDGLNISQKLIDTAPCRIILYGVLIFGTVLLDIFELDTEFGRIIKVIATIVLYAIISILVTRNLKKNIPQNNDMISGDCLAFIMTLELIQFMVLTFPEQSYLTIICLLCIWGRWFWLDDTPKASLEKICSYIPSQTKNKDLYKYYLTYCSTLKTAAVIKISIFFTVLFLPERNWDLAYLFTLIIFLVTAFIDIKLYFSKKQG